MPSYAHTNNNDNVRLHKSKISDTCPITDNINTNIPRNINYNELNAMKFSKKKFLHQQQQQQVQNDKDNITTQNEWLLDLCCSLQESALKALRLSNEKYEASLEHLKQQVDASDAKNAHRRDTFTPATLNHRSVPPMPQQHDPDLPPRPPPRYSASQPPPLPPPPSLHLRQRITSSSSTPTIAATRNKYAQQVTYHHHQHHNHNHNPQLIPPTYHLLLASSPSPSMASGYITASSNSTPLSDKHSNKLPYDYRNSPSSGFYSCSTSSPSPSSVSQELDNNTTGSNVWPYEQQYTSSPNLLPITTQFVKSTQVPRPMLQTAQAPNTTATTKDPPSYASAMQQRASGGNNAHNDDNEDEDDNSSSSTTSTASTPVHQHHSPIPERRKHQRDCKVRNYSPQAFKFFMEQHVENVLKSYRQRIFRRMQLENEMAKIGLSDETRDQMRKMLCQKESNYIRLKRAKMDKSMFTSIKVIGVGAFGEVALVRKTDTNHLYAMKTLCKANVLKRKQVAHVKAERDILAEADNEWVVKLYYSFQDNENLYFIMEYIPGGDLMSLLIKFGIFEEPLAKFYLAELTCAVESVHKIGFIHRDIKPDNILIDRDGHIKLTDFGLCTGFRWTHNSKYYNNDGHNRENSLDFSADNTVNCKCAQSKPLERRRRREHQRCQAHSLVGTPNYIAPEVLLRTGYTQLCDWWSVGVVLYEMLIGSPPFSADSPTETQYKIINWKSTLKIPPNCDVSASGVDLIMKLCTDQNQRLGKDASEIKQHPFFAGIDFDRGVRKITPPYTPTIHYLTDTSNFDPIDPQSLHESNSMTSDFSETSEEDGKPFHGFFEFTFRRFFDDAGGGVPFRTKINTPDESDNRIAIYV